MFVPRLDDAHVSMLRRWKRQKGRNNKKNGLELQRHEKITISCVVVDSAYLSNEGQLRRAAGRNAIWSRQMMSRRDGGGAAVSAAMESRQKGRIRQQQRILFVVAVGSA